MGTKASVGVAAAVALAVGIFASTAFARNFSTSSQTLRATFREVRVTGAFGNIVCQVTIEGSLHTRTIAKVVGSLVGYITAASLGPCSAGQATILRETLPWHLRYANFVGNLPNITQFILGIIRFSIRVREPLLTCLLESRPTETLALGLLREPTSRLLLTAELLGTIRANDCGMAEGRIETNEGPVTVLNSTTRIRLTLI
jgi:hypothetical protein